MSKMKELVGVYDPETKEFRVVEMSCEDLKTIFSGRKGTVMEINGRKRLVVSSGSKYIIRPYVGD